MLFRSDKISKIKQIQDQLDGYYYTHSARIPLTDQMRKEVAALGEEPQQQDTGSDLVSGFVGNIFDSILGKNTQGSTATPSNNQPPRAAPAGYHWVKE